MPCVTKNPKYKPAYNLRNDGFYECKYRAPKLTQKEAFYIELYYKIANTRDSNHNINYSVMENLARIYGLSEDDYLLLLDIVDIGNEVYMDRVKVANSKQGI